MSSHAWIDASAGVAGDMLLGAFFDAGADLAEIQYAIDLLVPGAVRLEQRSVRRAGLRASKVEVVVLAPDQQHRRWSDLQILLATSDLDPIDRDRALAVFARLAAAEARAHGIPPTDVHFHEVGALDSIADVVGVCVAIRLLGIDHLSASPVAVGSGRTSAAHGDLPIPVPAVAELALGWQISAGGVGELATPTGLALITTLATECTAIPAMSLQGMGIGAGSRDTPGRPNVTRVALGRLSPPADQQPADQQPAAEPSVVLQANLDDMDPRLLPGVLQQLLDAGAADAWLIPIVMKKGRPAHTLSVLCSPDRAAVLRAAMFAATSTFGVREQPFDKVALERGWHDVTVLGRPVAVKIAHRDGVIVRATAEFDSVAATAAATGVPAVDVLDAAVTAAGRAGLTAGRPVPELRAHQNASTRWDSSTS